MEVLDNTRQPRLSHARRWLDGIPYEIAFWRSYYGNRRRRADLFRWSDYGKECILDNFDLAAFMNEISGKNPDREPLILDVGCALSYVTGSRQNGKELNIRYIDPLAPFYNRILEDYAIDRPKITYGLAEALPALFRRGSVALVHVRNALDHSADPLGAILSALTVVQTGGVVYLRHHPDEAEHENYRGFHQYNISTDSDGNRLIIHNRTERIDVSDRLSGFADVEVSRTPNSDIVAVIRKLAEVPHELYDENTAAAYTAGMLEETMAHLHDASSSLRYQLKRLHSTVGHRLMRLLPYAIVNRIKIFLAKK